MIDPSPSPWKSRLTLLALVLLFGVPPLLAWMLLMSGWQPSATVNNGDLIQPPVKVDVGAWDGGITDDYFRGRWTILQVAGGACGATCAEALDQTARARIALDKDASRVQRLLLQPESAPPVPERTAKGARLVHASRATVRRLLGDGEQGAVYLIDPQGLRMMRYAMPLDAMGMLDDLERLLRASNEDIERYQRTHPDDAS